MMILGRIVIVSSSQGKLSNLGLVTFSYNCEDVHIVMLVGSRLFFIVNYFVIAKEYPTGQ